MRGKQRFISLTPAERLALEKGYKAGKKAIFRQRCQAILFSDQGDTIYQIADLFKLNRITIGNWLTRYENQGIEGLHTQIGQGRKPLLSVDNADHVSTVKQYLVEEGYDLKQVQNRLILEQALEVSRFTLQRFLKKLATDTNASDAGSPANQMKYFSRSVDNRSGSS